MTEKFYIKQIAPNDTRAWAISEWFYWDQELNDILKKDLDGALLKDAYDSVNWEKYYERLKGTPFYDWAKRSGGILSFGGPYHIEHNCFFSTIGDISIVEGDWLREHPDFNQVLHDIHKEAVTEMINFILQHAKKEKKIEGTKNKKCVVCIQKKGKRICKLYNNEIICPLCCVKYRSSNCKGCLYYVESERYLATKVQKSESEDFIAEINEEVDEAVNQALSIAEKGNIEKGEAIISELRENHPMNPTVYYGLGVINAFKENYDEAIVYFDEAIKIFPYFIEAHFNKGVAYQKKLDVINMVKSFKEVVTIGDPEDDIVKRAQKSIKEIEQSIKKTCNIDLETFLEAAEKFNEALSYMEKGEWKKAINRFEECLLRNKRHVQSYGNIGLCYAFMGQKEQALAAFDKALEIDPTYEPALINRKVVESLKDGEKLKQYNFISIEYYKNRALEKKSLIQSILRKIMKIKLLLKGMKIV